MENCRINIARRRLVMHSPCLSLVLDPSPSPKASLSTFLIGSKFSNSIWVAVSTCLLCLLLCPPKSMLSSRRLQFYGLLTLLFVLNLKFPVKALLMTGDTKSNLRKGTAMHCLKFPNSILLDCLRPIGGVRIAPIPIVKRRLISSFDKDQIQRRLQ